jgi:hypothetical protein
MSIFRERLLGEAKRIRERPDVRQRIIEEKLVPDIVMDRRGLRYWDALSARSRIDGMRKLFGMGTASPIQLELKRLAIAGYFGDLSGVVINIFRYSEIREAIDRKRGALLDAKVWELPQLQNASRSL